MLTMWENDRIFIAPDMDINLLYAQGYTDDEIEEKLNEKAEDNPKNAGKNTSSRIKPRGKA